MGRVGRHEENRPWHVTVKALQKKSRPRILSRSLPFHLVYCIYVIERRLKSCPAARSAGSGTRRGVQLRDLRHYDRDFRCFADSDPQVPRPDFDWDSTYLQGIQAV